MDALTPVRGPYKREGHTKMQEKGAGLPDNLPAKDQQEAGRRHGDGFSLREARRSNPAKSLIPDCWLFPWPGAQPAQ